MTQRDYVLKADELDRLLNDPDVELNPRMVWSLLAELSAYDAMQAESLARR